MASKIKGHPFSVLQSQDEYHILFDIHKQASKLNTSAIESNEELFNIYQPTQGLKDQK